MPDSQGQGQMNGHKKLAQDQGGSRGSGGASGLCKGQDKHRARNEGREQFSITDDQIARILNRDGETMVSVAKELADRLQSVKASQLRNFYGSLLKLEARIDCMEQAQIATEFHLLRPKLQYMVTREPKAMALNKAFEKLLKNAATRIAESKDKLHARDVARYVFEFAEAVIAYHK